VEIEETFSSKDFTFYILPPAVDKDSLRQWLSLSENDKAEVDLSNDHALGLQVRGRRAGTILSGRALACRIGNTKDPDGAAWSVTLRHAINNTGLRTVPNNGVDPTAESKWKAGNDFGSQFLNSQFEVIDTLSETIWHQLGTGSSPGCAQGLLAIFGATASGKNWVSRGLIHRYLTDERVASYYQQVKKRRPHLVTFEDPIEEWFWPEGSPRLPSLGEGDSPGPRLRYKDPNDPPGLDYTPRQKGATADTIAITLSSALRQTPAAVYIGETRDQKDWNHILKFAGTGHFVTTTAHAGSLVESIGALLGARDAKTAAARRDVADRMVAVVHLRQERITAFFKEKSVEMAVTLPAVWLNHSHIHALCRRTSKVLFQKHSSEKSNAARIDPAA
jgi:hypothetical protein